MLDSPPVNSPELTRDGGITVSVQNQPPARARNPTGSPPPRDTAEGGEELAAQA